MPGLVLIISTVVCLFCTIFSGPSPTEFQPGFPPKVEIVQNFGDVGFSLLILLIMTGCHCQQSTFRISGQWIAQCLQPQLVRCRDGPRHTAAVVHETEPHPVGLSLLCIAYYQPLYLVGYSPGQRKGLRDAGATRNADEALIVTGWAVRFRWGWEWNE